MSFTTVTCHLTCHFNSFCLLIINYYQFQLFESGDNSRTRGNGVKLKEGRFQLDVRGKFFTRRVVRCWNGLLREAVDAPSIPGGVQGQVGWGPGQPGLVNGEVDGPVHGRGIGDS